LTLESDAVAGQESNTLLMMAYVILLMRGASRKRRTHAAVSPELAADLRSLRQESGLAQTGLAYFASNRGVEGQSWISDMERAIVPISRTTLVTYVLLSVLTAPQIEEAMSKIDALTADW
jgi:hypothetical protein